MDRGSWQATVHGVPKSQTGLSDQHFHFFQRRVLQLPSLIVDMSTTHLKRFWCWEGLRAEGEGDHRGWDGWMASPTRWTWVWVDSGSWWWTGRPGVLRFMGSKRVGHYWATELNYHFSALTAFASYILKLCSQVFIHLEVFSLLGGLILLTMCNVSL